MLPKLNKNIFQAKVDSSEKKSFGIKKLLISILFAGSAVIANANSSLPQESEQISKILQSEQVTAFTLQPSEKGIKTLAYHYSHRSHYSHGSHRSHYSHYSSRY